MTGKRTENDWSEKDVKELLDKYNNRLNYKDIASHFNLSVNCIYKEIFKLKKQGRIRLPRRGWTEEQDDILRSNISRMTYKEIATLVGKTEDCTKRRAKLLTISKKAKPFHKSVWNEKDYATLEAGWGVLTIKTISNALNKTERAVLSMGRKENLGGLYNNDYNCTIKFICSALNVNRAKIKNWFEKGLKYKKKRLCKRVSYFIDIEDLKSFLKENQNEWSGYNLDTEALGPSEDWFYKKVKIDTINNNKYKTLKHWSTKEINQLTELLDSKKSIKECSSILNRTTSSVYEMKRRLNKK